MAEARFTAGDLIVAAEKGQNEMVREILNSGNVHVDHHEVRFFILISSF